MSATSSPTSHLEPDETRALQIAFATIRSASGGEIAAGELALWKLGATSADAELPVVAHVPELSSLPTLRDAAARRRTVTFRYHATPRHVDPFGVLLRNGFWYVIGREHEADQQRTYRVDRIEGDVAVTGADHAFERPVGFDPRDQLPSDAKRVGVGDAVVVDAVVRVSAARAAMIEREVGSEHVRAPPRRRRRRCRGAVRQRRRVRNLGARADRPRRGARPAGGAGGGDRAARARRRPHARCVGESRASEYQARLGSRVHAADVSGTAHGARSRATACSRLLVVLPWLMERHEVPIAEVAAAFRMTPAEVTAELELASMCGLPPFVDEMIDIFVDEDTVFVGVPRLFTKPLRLTAPEGFALLAAGRAAMQLPGADPDGPLGRGLAKLAAALGEEPDDAALVMDLAATPLVDVLVAAAVVGERLRIRYWTASRDEVTERTIVPRRVFHERGDWFVSADDERSGEERTFRADRIEQLDRTGEIVPRAGDADPLDRAGGSSVAWISDGSVPRVTLRLRPGARWVRRAVPGRPRHRARRRRRRRGDGGDQRALAGAAVVACRAPTPRCSPRRNGSISGARGAPTARSLRHPAGVIGVDDADRPRPAEVQRVELGLVGDAVRVEEVGEHGGGGGGVGERVVVRRQRHAVAGAHVGQPVGERPIGVEAP